MGQKSSHSTDQITNKNWHNPRRSEIIEIVYEDEQDYETVYADGMKSGDSCPTNTGSPMLSDITHTFSPKVQMNRSQTDNKRKTFHFRNKTGSVNAEFLYYEPALTTQSTNLNRNIEMSRHGNFNMNDQRYKCRKLNSPIYSKSFDNQSDTVNQVGDQDSDITESIDHKITPLESETCYPEFSSLLPTHETHYGMKTSYQESKLINYSDSEWYEVDHNDYPRFPTGSLSPRRIYPSSNPAEFLTSSCNACSQLKRSLTYHSQPKTSKSTPSSRSNGPSRINTVQSQTQNSPIVELSFAMNEISSEFLDPSVHNGMSSDGTSNWTKYYANKTNRTLQNEAYATRFLARKKITNEKETKSVESPSSRLTKRSSNTSIVDLRMEPDGDMKNLNTQTATNISITARSASWCSRKSPSLVLFTVRPVLMFDNYELSTAKQSHASVYKKVGLTNLEGCFVGGNVTSTSRQTETPKFNTVTQKSNQCENLVTNALSPISRPIHVYSYRFWVTNGPSIDNIFKNRHDRRIESIGRLSDCRIRLTRNMRRNHQGFIQRMVNIIAPSGPALQKCCKLFDDKFPEFYASSGLLMKDDELANPSNFGIRPSTARLPKRQKHMASHNRNRYGKKCNTQIRKLRKTRSLDHNDIHSFDTHTTCLRI